jgi:outer membrane receptor protein involved in Fe transport
MRSSVRCLAVLAIALVVPALVAAQTESGKVTGTVTDQSGAVLPGVTVTLKSVGRATTRSTVTNTDGEFVLASLVPGAYEVTAELPGFSTKLVRTTVPVGATVNVNVQMQVGAQTEIITVVGETAAAINTSTQDITTTVNETQIRELPTIYRNPYDFVQLSGQAASDPNSGRGAGYAINGQRSSSTNVLLDGSANNDEFGATIGQNVPLDAVQEFSVLTSNFSAQFGRATGGIVNVATKSGTNTFRGTVYEFFRNEKLSANTFDNKARGNEKGTFDRHQMGFSLGGPLVKDKVHFFTSLEYIRVRSISPTTRWVVTPDFVARTNAATQAFFTKYQLASYSKPNGVVLTRSQVPGYAAGGLFAGLPADLPVFQQVVYDLPADAGGGFPRNEYQWVARVDWSLSPSTSFYVRYAGQDQQALEGANTDSPYQGFNTSFLNKNHNVLGSLTHVFSSTLTSQTKVVWNRLLSDQPLGEQPPAPTLYMFNARAYAIQGINVAFPGYLPFNPGTAIPFGGPQQLFQVYQDFNWVKDRHDIRVGGSYDYMKDDRTFGAYMNPVQGLGTTTQMGLDNLVRGQIYLFQGAIDPQGKFPGETIQLPVTFPSFTRNNRYNEWAAYLNDTWSVTDRLKLNLGVRYEYYGVQQNSDPKLDSNFYFGSGSNLYQQERNGSVQIAPDSPVGGLWAPDKNNFAPRVGFAWDVTGDGKTSLRGGYGMAYERNFGNVTYNVIQNPPNYATVSLTAPSDIPSMPIYSDITGPLGGTGSKTLPVVQLRAVDPHIVNAWAHFWSVSLQREIFPNTTASIEYTGSKGVDLYSISNINRTGFGAYYLGDASLSTRPNTTYSRVNFRTNGGSSLYHGITLGLESRKLADTGLQFTARYTLGWAKDDLSNTFSEGGNNGIANGLGFLDPLNPDLDWGYAEFDVRHRLVGSAIWELPLARNSTGFAKALLNGWQLSLLFNAQSGAPFSIGDCSNGVDFYCARMAQLAPINGYTAKAQPDVANTWDYLDISNQSAGVGTIASALTGDNELWADADTSKMSKRDAFRAPGTWNIDAGLSKRFRFGDRFALQLRLEAYNLFNHANLYLNGAEADISSTTMITAYKDGARRLQIAAKFEF